MNTKYFITGIGTGIGKTVTSAILTQYFKADYWKPVQSGDLDRSDSMLVSKFNNENIDVHPERYRLKYPASPHQSAAMENIEIKVRDFELPDTENILLTEGAGGLFVPLNNTEFMIDLITHLNVPVILVVRDYLGCINHTLLSVEALRSRDIEIAFVVLNGNFVAETKEIILKHIPSGTKVIELPELDILSKESIQKAADIVQQQLK
ncbi:dethiobiotin synthase [Elizabethkingia meningoseptica]|uniref:ATP-dependent dethiobiotin synthetase BioD n=1 Tax=Elizabethkingia meningoseptica TaxID=238 RepID=A0A1T3IU24_ELIME|nr:MULTISPECIES: dethiobiotin synthase [Elizabethkingia]EJK5330008.1 dethiobiotin synthase [Elizabethkingia meningoseptica]MBG0512328.1 dethiobiotin synthase [Elizabethkingia meningoseptica]MDE5435634.1 dethiobiotin synthase [Elizabethkingia meningoseptica]MDE5450510.1 dethiobiotin synthase [Elizabethkingia meningoseptica]MDE5466429.1 dethiobiotin synthase [Elizabethkingia meningoseptica]